MQPANEVWGKVIFSQASVCPRGGVSVQREGVSVKGGLCPVEPLSRESLSGRHPPPVR